MLEEAGRPMHIKEIKQRIIDRGLVQSKYSNPLRLPHILLPMCSHVKPNHETLCLSCCSLLGSAKSSLEAVMYREVRRMFKTQSDSILCC